MSIIVKCLACGKKNRVSESQLSKRAICGKCQSILSIPRTPKPTLLSETNFDSYIQKSTKPVLIDCWASWCAPCKMLEPVLEEFAALHPSISVAKVDVEANQVITAKLRISTVPTLILFVDNREVKRISGAVSLQVLENELNPWITIN